MVSIKEADRVLSERFGSLWQLIKFNLVSSSVTLIQLILANTLPLLFDQVTTTLPKILQPIFNPDVLFTEPSRYVVNGVVTYGYVLPFLLSNGLANIYGYFVNMRATFRGKGTNLGFAFYIVLLFALILFSTWLQGILVAKLQTTFLSNLARTAAALFAGFVQMIILFPMEKFVLFRQ